MKRPYLLSCLILLLASLLSCSHGPAKSLKSNQTALPFLQPKSGADFIHRKTHFRFPFQLNGFEFIDQPIKDGTDRTAHLRVQYTIRRPQTQPLSLEITLDRLESLPVVGDARELYKAKIMKAYPKAHSLDDSDFKISNTEADLRGFRVQWLVPGVAWAPTPGLWNETTESVGDDFVFALKAWRIEFHFLYLDEERKTMRNQAQDFVRDLILKVNEGVIFQL